jgi:hypothetical protein
MRVARSTLRALGVSVKLKQPENGKSFRGETTRQHGYQEYSSHIQAKTYKQLTADVAPLQAIVAT